MVFGRESPASPSLDPHSTTVKSAFWEPIAAETKRAFGSFRWFDRKAFTVYTAQNKPESSSMRRFVLSVLLSLSLIIPAHAQGFDEVLAAIDPAEIGLAAEDIQNFAATMHRVPERGRERYQSAFTQLSSDVQALVLRTHARFATGEERPDIALAVSTTNLYFQIQGLITYIEEDVFPESGQLPNAVAQLDRLYRKRPGIERHFGAGFRAQVEEIQQTARAAYEERLAAYEERLAADLINNKE